MDKIPTFVAPLPEEFEHDKYLPYNKIVAVLHWIQAEHKNLPPDQIIAIMDVDIVLLEGKIVLCSYAASLTFGCS